MQEKRAFDHFSSQTKFVLAKWTRMTWIAEGSGLNSHTEDVLGKENEWYQVSIRVKFVGDILYIYSSVYVASGIHKLQQ